MLTKKPEQIVSLQRQIEVAVEPTARSRRRRAAMPGSPTRAIIDGARSMAGGLKLDQAQGA
jgi:hypothetical protein